MKKILLTARLPFIIITAIAFQLNMVSGQVATLKNWTSVYHGNSTAQQNVTYPVPVGSNNNRILVVAIASSRTPLSPISVTLSYGNQPLTLANGDMGATGQHHTALYYLDEAGLDAAENSTLSVAVGGGTICITDVWAAVFDYINQTAPLSGSQNYNSGPTPVISFAFGTPLTINPYNQAVEIVSSFSTSVNQMRTINYADEWTMIRDSTAIFRLGFSGYAIRNGVANRSIPASSLTDVSSTTFSGTALASMTALSLNYEVPPHATVPASNVTFTDVTSSSFTINWTPGDGTNHLILVKAGNPVDGSPVNGTTYTASHLFGSGSQIETGNYVVFNGSGNNVTVYNLEANTTYHVAVYEFSGPPGLEFYLIPNPATGSQLTLAESALLNDYRTFQSGSWADPATWQTFDGGSWVPATISPTNESGVITIRTGHTITVGESVSADQLIIAPEAQVTVNSGITLTIENGAGTVDLIINGILQNSGEITVPGSITFDGGSVYRHTRDGGSVPPATWDVNSTCMITGVTTTAPAGFEQSFGNLTWNCASQTSTAALNSNITVLNNFTLTSTGTGKISLTNNSTSRTLTVEGNFDQSGGIMDFNSDPAGSAIAYLNVGRNFYFIGGTILNSSSGGRGSITFNGGGQMQYYTSGGTFSGIVDFTVANGAYFQLGTAPAIIAGSSGNFTVESGATLGITDRYGITLQATGSTGGNIQVTGTRTYNSSANYIYNGLQKQNTGNGLPSEVNSLVLNNSAGVVTLDAARTITSDFSINTGSKASLGSFIHSTGSLILGGLGQPAGSYGGETSPAENIIPEYFDASTGIVNNAAPDGSWLGITSDWNSATNWVGGIPTSESHAKISSWVLNQPVINGAITAESNIVTLNHGATLTVGNTGKATFSSLVNNGTIYLNSDATGIASLILDSYSGTGNTNIQLYLTGGGNETNYPWHYISSPVAALSVTDVIRGGIGPDANDLAAYHEDLVTDNKDLAWIGYDGWNYQSNDGLPAGTAFSNLETGTGYNYYSYYDATRVFGGDFNTGDITKTLSYTGASDGLAVKGWNFLGNPFSASLNWDDIALTLPAGIDNAIYFTRNNTVVSYVNGVPSTGGVTANIPPMQGFFVKANSSGQSIALTASARVHSTQNRYKGEGEVIPLIRLKIESNKITDETVICFDEKAKSSFDSHLDAYKFGTSGAYLSLWSVNGPVDYSINSVPFPETVTEIPAGVNIPTTGTYKLSASQLQGLGNYDVFLLDKNTGTSINLKTTQSLSFASREGKVSDRFVIRIINMSNSIGDSEASQSTFKIYSTNRIINIQTLSDNWDGKSGTVSLIDITGKEIKRIERTEFWKGSLIQITADELSGIYFIKLNTDSGRYVGRVIVK